MMCAPLRPDLRLVGTVTIRGGAMKKESRFKREGRRATGNGDAWDVV